MEELTDRERAALITKMGTRPLSFETAHLIGSQSDYMAKAKVKKSTER